jgi:hypothetical protein
MNKDEVLDKFREEATKLQKTHIRQSDTLLLLAKVVADAAEQLSIESFDTLVYIGASISKTCTSQARARSELATTMKKSTGVTTTKIDR